MKILQYVGLGVLFLGGITACHPNGKDYEYFTGCVTDSLLDFKVEEIPIQGDTLLYDVLYPTGICVADTFLLFAQHKDKDLIHVYSLNDTTFLGSFLNVGGGPNEVAIWNGFAQPVWKEEDGHKLLIQSYPSYLAILNLEKSLERKTAVFDKRYSCNTDSARALLKSSNVAFWLEGNTFLFNRSPERTPGMHNPNMFGTVFNMDTDKKESSFYYMNMKPTSYYFLYYGASALRPDKQKLCFGGYNMDVFSITDLTSGKTVQYFPSGKNPDVDDIIQKQRTESFYQSVAVTQNRIVFLSNNGQSPADKEKPLVSYLDIFDWEGRFGYRLKLSEHLYYISLDVNTGYLYAVLEDCGLKRYDLSTYLR